MLVKLESMVSFRGLQHGPMVGHLEDYLLHGSGPDGGRRDVARAISEAWVLGSPHS